MSSHNHIRDLYGGDPRYEYHQDYHNSSFQWPKLVSLGLPACLLVLALAYSGFHALDFNLLPLQELLWNCLVYATPSRLLYVLDNDLNQRAMADPDLRNIPQTHAAKSSVMRRILGFDKSGGIISTVAQAGRRRLSIIPGINITSKAEDGRPPGLGNWDNSCYQNSVLQGLASLDTLPGYLVDPRRSAGEEDAVEDADNTDMKMSDALRGLISTLKDSSNNGKRIWTPATLKSMSSWQQQDAQEYFSKVLDEIDKEVTKAANAVAFSQGLEPVYAEATQEKAKSVRGMDVQVRSSIRNPLEGLLAQRVGCTRCGYSEGLSMIPFNCLTVPLGRAWAYKISECLDEYTKLEGIEGVQCGKCTLLKTQRLLSIILERTKDAPEGDKVRQSTIARLQTITEALEDDDYEDKTLTQKCNIPPKNRMTTTKSRQAVIARPPKSLAVHINRSLFDEMTGELKKNYAEVRFPRTLDLGPWCLGSSGTEKGTHFEEWLLDPAQSMIAGSEVPSRVRGPIYELRSAVTHYGRHENGHYICYRKHPAVNSEEKDQWWRLSDDDVMKVDEDNVLGQGGVFMLFYDIVEPASSVEANSPATELSVVSILQSVDIAVAANTPLPTTSDDDIDSSDGDEDDSSMRASRDQSIATSISEFEGEGMDKEFQSTKAILIPPYIPDSGAYHGGENKEHAIQSPGSMVMV